VEQQAGNEKIVGKPAAAHGGNDEAGKHEACAQNWNATVGQVADMRENGFGPSSLAFR
jgi:hypothetical protein